MKPRRTKVAGKLLVGVSTLLILGVCAPSPIIGSSEFSMTALTLSRLLPVTTQVMLKLGSGKLRAEIASTPHQAATGLAFRATLAPNDAMLFVYQAPHRVVFHMKDTYIPLSIAYIDSKGDILEIHDLTPGGVTPLVSWAGSVQFVLEVNLGWFEKHGVVPGSRVNFVP